VHGARGKRHGEARDKASKFLARFRSAAYWFSTVENPGEQARCLKELEVVTALEQNFF